MTIYRIIILADFAQIMDYQTWVNNNEMNSTKYIDKIQEQRKEDAEEPFYIQTIKVIIHNVKNNNNKLI